MNPAEFHHASFGAVDKNAFRAEAEFLKEHNVVYNKARYNRDIVEAMPYGEDEQSKVPAPVQLTRYDGRSTRPDCVHACGPLTWSR